LSDNTDKSLFHLTEALKLARKIKSKKLQHYSYLYLGRLHRDIGQYQEAGKYLTEAIAYFTQKKHISRLAESYLAFGRLQFALGEFELAIDAVNKSILHAKEIEKNIVIFQAYKELSVLFEKTNNLKKALNNERLFQFKKEPIFNRQSQHYINALKVEYNVEQKQREIETLKQKSKISDLEVLQQRANRNIYIISSLLVFCSLGFISYRYNQRKKLHAKRIALQQIKVKEQALSELNANLESIVEQRTQSLQSSNQELEIALVDLKDTQKSLIEVEKMASLSLLVAGVAHEMNTPLAIILTAASYLNEQLDNFKQLVITDKISRNGLNDFLTSAKQGVT